MTKYLRLGDIPKNEKSVRWSLLTISQREYLTECVDIYGEDVTDAVNTAKKHLKDWQDVNVNNLFECGVSVFELDENEQPVLSNDKLAESYKIRKDEKHIIVTGDLVGIGDDGEPLIINVKEV